MSEMLTIVIHSHQVGFRNFKTYYQLYVRKQLHSESQQLLSYSRFVQRHPLYR